MITFETVTKYGIETFKGENALTTDMIMKGVWMALETTDGRVITAMINHDVYVNGEKVGKARKIESCA